MERTTKKIKEQSYEYFAFISYNSHDIKWGKRLQRKLEHYRMPAALCSQHGWVRTPIKPIFFAPTDIQPGPLSEELKERLRNSRNLIVVCSPNSAQSKWVGWEIEYFHQLGRTKQIHLFIVEGVPHSGNTDTECINPMIDKLGLPEILGANIHEKIFRWNWLNKERAYVQLISKLLNVEFDAIWQRHKRLMIQKSIGWIVGVIMILTALWAVWETNQPVDVEVNLCDTSVQNEYLPSLKDAIVTMTLANEIKRDTIHALGAATMFRNIPQKYIGKWVCITVSCKYFQPIDTCVVLMPQLLLNIRREPSIFGDIHFSIWDNSGRRISNVKVCIAGYETTSNENGKVTLSIPLEKQRTKYFVTASIPLMKDTVYMPCGEDGVILAK